MAVAYANGPDIEGSRAQKGQMTSGLDRFSWFALQVRTRHEVGVAGILEGKGYELFLPLYKCRKRWSDRIMSVELPLFPGYLFCRFNPQDRLPIVTTPGVIQVVGYNRLPIAVEDSEIRAIQTLVTSGLPNRPWPFLEVGDPVRIEAGPLRGLEGLLIDFKGNHRLVLSIALLHRAVAVEIDSVSVKSLRAPSSQRARNSSEAQLQPAPLTV
jgi:transcription antitermination factor NusG